MYIVWNVIENIEVFTGEAKEFIAFAELIRDENFDHQHSILGLSDAVEYIETFCPNLSLSKTEV